MVLPERESWTLSGMTTHSLTVFSQISVRSISHVSAL
jgi:hypothetical protein